jgi:hypothetical protein
MIARHKRVGKNAPRHVPGLAAAKLQRPAVVVNLPFFVAVLDANA